MHPALQSLTVYFDQQDWTYYPVNDTAIHGVFRSPRGCWPWRAYVEEGHLFFHASVPIPVPATRLPAIAEFLCRVNWGLSYSHFCIDWSDGEINHFGRVTLHQGTDLTPEDIEHLVCGSCTAMFNFLPGFLDVIYEKLTPEEALAQCTTPPPEETVPDPEPAPAPGEGSSNGAGVKVQRRRRRASGSEN